MTLLTISATFPGLRPKCYPEDDCHPTDSQSALAFVSRHLIPLALVVLRLVSHPVEQISLMTLMTLRKKHKSSFFLSINVGAIIAGSVLVLDCSGIKSLEAALSLASVRCWWHSSEKRKLKFLLTGSVV
ncbi:OLIGOPEPTIDE TRANSPORTER-RELATED [Salix koriyanagi]|uniref:OLIGOPEPTIDE TRANSPORTER-RELATED n=1 Tax=Salix koriyanagi TaxID=2511006 RepID=A0A9Q0X4I4_9ROSI|nr:OLIGOPEPTIDE TRANSPORTER-RELATED [Salix koriyanagi]